MQKSLIDTARAIRLALIIVLYIREMVKFKLVKGMPSFCLPIPRLQTWFAISDYLFLMIYFAKRLINSSEEKIAKERCYGLLLLVDL